MKREFKIFACAFALYSLILSQIFAQGLTQTVRGTVIDNDNKQALTGVAVLIEGTNPPVGTLTDDKGYFRIESVPVGRISLKLSLIGYETLSIPDIVVNTGKESLVNTSMQEMVVKLDEVVVKANQNKGVAINDMSLLSGRSISTEETQRFTGAFNDPSRVVASFAGVTSGPEGNSDIIVRGNSPKYIQWRLEGVEIPSPYHFDDQNAAGGGLSTINNNLLATSDFYTGAFSPEYGDVLSGVYDVKFRAGNNEKFEASIGAGLIGTDVTFEGPFSKGYGGSYLVNYRYATVSLIQDMGLVDLAGITNFQDAAFNIKLPTKSLGTFSFFGLTGFDDFLLEDVSPKIWPTPTNKTSTSDISEDFEKNAYLANLGFSHIYSLGTNQLLKSTFVWSGKGISDDINEKRIVRITDNQGHFIKDSLVSPKLTFKNRLNSSVYRAAITYSNKINSRNKIEIGTKYSLYSYEYQQDMFNGENQQLEEVFGFNENVVNIRNFISWKFRFNDQLTFVSGIHNMNVLFNRHSTIEPRIAMNWRLNPVHSFNMGYGLHSTMENIPNYFAKVQQPDGSFEEPNKNLGFLKAHHYVIGYETRLSENLRAKVDLYYQDLFNLPVENVDTSYYATINEGIDYKYVALVNRGTGQNYGAEVTIERFFKNNYYYLITGSIYNSTYKSLEGIERNTRYNNRYLCNILVGKEFVNLGKKQNKTLGVNTRIYFRGGQPYLPLLRNAEGDLAVDPTSNSFWDYDNAYRKSMEDIYQINLSVSYKINKKNKTHEFYLDLQNLTGNLGKLNEYYDESEPGSIGHITQFGFFPNLMYKFYF